MPTSIVSGQEQVRVGQQAIPVVMVHGWNSHPGIWNRLVRHLDPANEACWRFDHSVMPGLPLQALALQLGEYIGEMREKSKYFGPIDIVCHSMGTGIARYLLEVLDGEREEERVRQLIGIGPPNNGSTLAELFFDPVYGPAVVNRLAGVFVPAGFDPSEDITVQEFRPGSRTMKILGRAGIRRDILYRIILGSNLTGTPDFFPWFLGRTWEWSQKEEWHMTFQGDGIVSIRDSYLEGACLDILPEDPGCLVHSPDQFCHIQLPRNPWVMDLIQEYLKSDPCNIPYASTD